MMADDTDPALGVESDSARTEAAEDAAMLKELAQIGLRLARLVEENAESRMALDPATNLGRADQAFAKISRSVRQTLALKAKLAEIQEKHAAAVEKEAQERAADAARLHWQKTRLKRAVAETIDVTPDAENLLSDLYERLSDPDIEADLASGSIGEMVAQICDDLGIAPDREVWSAKGWYLTEGWHARLPKPDSAAPATEPEIPWAERVAPFLAEMDRVTCPVKYDAAGLPVEQAVDHPGPS